MLEEEGIVFDESGTKILQNFFVEGESSTLLPMDDLRRKSKTETMASGNRKVEIAQASRTKKSKYFDTTDIEATIKVEILNLLQKRDVGKTC